MIHRKTIMMLRCDNYILHACSLASLTMDSALNFIGLELLR